MKISAIVAGALLIASVPAAAASLLTSSAGYSGPTLDTGGLGEPFYLFTAGPVALPGGITYTASSANAVIGIGGYGFDTNGGTTTTPIVGTNGGSNWIDLTFATAVAEFGGGFNYAPDNGSAPTISAYDATDTLIATYDLAALAPISTPAAIDVFLFRGIDGEGQLIKRFRLEGSFIVLAATSTAVPEPATWALMIAGFGLVGFAARRRSAAIAA